MPNADTFETMHFPSAGIDWARGFGNQRPREVIRAQWSRSTVTAQNVRGFDAKGLRLRGGSRPGLDKYVSGAIVADWIVQGLDTLVYEGGTPVQLSQSGRVVTLVAVSQGDVFSARAGEDSWTQATNSSGATPPLNYTGIVYSTSLNQKLWFADGVNQRFYDPLQNTVFTWVPTAGTLPADENGNTARLICTWQGRILESGLLLDPQNVFACRVGVPTDWNYFPTDFDVTQAFAFGTAPFGLVGDVVTSLCPYSNDLLLIFCDHSIWALKGDPLLGGRLDLISDAIGGVWGICWCKDPYGNVYFVSNKTGIYMFQPDQGQQPQRISQGIEQLLLSIDTGANGIRLAWNDRYQALQVFVTPLQASAASTHFFWEQRTGAWFTDTFANPNHSPLAMCVFDGNLPGDRHLVIGSWDGYVRTFSPDSSTDDGYPIDSEVLIGPLLTKDFDEILLKDLQAIMGATSGEVDYEVFTGATAELAVGSGAVSSGKWSATTENGGRNLTSFVRRSGHAVYVRISSENQWAMEQIRARIATEGKVRRRGF